MAKEFGDVLKEIRVDRGYSQQYVLARRDKRFLILFSEGLTRAASQCFGMHRIF